MRVMSAGHGYRYLLDSVAVGDGAREPGRPLSDYYTQPGCPPGWWLGSGLQGLGDGQLNVGDVVTETQLGLLLGAGCDPVTGAPVGRAYPVYRSRQERIAIRVTGLDEGLAGEQRAAAVARIEAEETARVTRRAVAGFDLTFSVPKSVSVLWALADPDTQARIIAAHQAAIGDVIGLVERDVAATRMGATGPDGAVAQVPVTGVTAVAFDHWDSRAGDPQLHTHVVIANKVQTEADGKWRSLDGRPIHAAMVALSEHYNAVLADRLTMAFGVVWQEQARERDRNPGWEISGIPTELLQTFSSRATAIGTATDALVADYMAAHGRRPSARAMIRLRQQATLATRPNKTVYSLADLTNTWRARAAAVPGAPVEDWLPRVLTGRAQQLLRADHLPDHVVAGIGGRVVEVVGERRSTWRHWNLHAEASRQLMGVRFATPADRDTILARVVAAAQAASVQLTPPDLAPVPVELQRPDGSSVLRPRQTAVFTSTGLLAAEDDLVRLSHTTSGPRVPDVLITADITIGADQSAALVSVAASGRVVDVLVGPAGAGKTTAMRTLRQAWEQLYGAGSVVGLAPSAAAAEVLGADLDIATDTTAKWLHEHGRGRVAVQAGQLVIVDEASLAGTHTLHALATSAVAAGAKVLLVGDPGQLAAVEAGGAFALLASDRDDVAELTEVRRFHQPWERDASLQLRRGNPAVIDTYTARGRLCDGDSDAMLDAAFTAWRQDLAAGRSSLLIAPTREQVTALNRRAQADRIAARHVDLSAQVGLHDGTAAGAGDLVVTRRNDRELVAASGRWVRNGDRWRITAIRPDGSLTAQPTGRTGGTIILPASYVSAHVELGYAVTAHRAQGSTVDTAHAIVTAGMARETLYVAMTRGRESNIAYTITDQPDTEPHQNHGGARPDVRRVLDGVLARVGVEPSATQALRGEQDRWGGITQLAAEYETIAAAAQHERWTTLIRGSGLTPDQAEQVIASTAFGPFNAALRHAEAHHYDPEQFLPRLLTHRPLGDADEIAAVLHHRLATAITPRTGGSQGRPVPRLIAGLIPHAGGPMPEQMRIALDERAYLIEQRARHLARTAVTDGAPWVRHLGHPPRDPQHRAAWTKQVTTIAAYRDPYHITSATPLGEPDAVERLPDAFAARTAFRHAQNLARTEHFLPPSAPSRPGIRRSAGPTL